ncbi:hypothetical protein ACUR5C_04125 [Aliikangiella sp. IMCC44653]
MKSISIAVKLQSSYEGLMESSGLLALKDTSILLQYQSQDSLLGMIKSDVKEVELPLKHIEEVQFKKSIFGHKIIISVDDLKLSAKLPGSQSNQISLSVARADADQGSDFVRAIKLDMSEREYQAALKDA